MRLQDVQAAAKLEQSYRGIAAMVQSCEQLPDDQAITVRIRQPGGLEANVPISKKTIIKDLLEQQATVADKLTKMGVRFDEPADDPEPQGQGVDPARR